MKTYMKKIQSRRVLLAKYLMLIFFYIYTYYLRVQVFWSTSLLVASFSECPAPCSESIISLTVQTAATMLTATNMATINNMMNT